MSTETGNSLSKMALFILGIVAEKPVNPYAIIKLLNYKRRNLRRYIPPQTVYGIINTLNRKRLIAGKRVKNGKMPDRTVYSVTPKGEDTIRKSLLPYLNRPEDILSDLALAGILIGYLDKELVLKALKEHRDILEKEIAIQKKLISNNENPERIYIRQIIARHTLKMQQVNLETVKEFIESIEKDKRWSDFRVPWWRDEYLQNGEQEKEQDTTASMVE